MSIWTTRITKESENEVEVYRVSFWAGWYIFLHFISYWAILPDLLCLSIYNGHGPNKSLIKKNCEDMIKSMDNCYGIIVPTISSCKLFHLSFTDLNCRFNFYCWSCWNETFSITYRLWYFNGRFYTYNQSKSYNRL